MKGPKKKWVGGSRLSCCTKLSLNSKLTAPQHPVSAVSLPFSDTWITFTSSRRLTFFYCQEFIFPNKHRKVGLLHAIMKFAFFSDVFNTYHKWPLCQGSANFFCIEPNGRDFMLCKLWCLWHSYAALLLQYEISHRQHINEWMWLHYNNILFTKTGDEPDLI